jgi:hypothetical protein
MADFRRSSDLSSQGREEDRRRADLDLELQERLRYKIDFLHF